MNRVTIKGELFAIDESIVGLGRPFLPQREGCCVARYEQLEQAIQTSAIGPHVILSAVTPKTPKRKEMEVRVN